MLLNTSNTQTHEIFSAVNQQGSQSVSPANVFPAAFCYMNSNDHAVLWKLATSVQANVTTTQANELKLVGFSAFIGCQSAKVCRWHPVVRCCRSRSICGCDHFYCTWNGFFLCLSGASMTCFTRYNSGANRSVKMNTWVVSVDVNTTHKSNRGLLFQALVCLQGVIKLL